MVNKSYIFIAVSLMFVGLILASGSGTNTITGNAAKGGGSVKTSCLDSDGGSFPNVYGQVTGIDLSGSRYTYADECYSTGKSVLETTCYRNLPKTTNTNCATGLTCSQGKCIISPEKCSDSDGGKFPNIYGYATGTYLNNSNYTLNDYCKSGTVVSEISCNGTKVIYSDISCANGYNCVSGACIVAAPTDSCTDSDGLNPNNLGTITGYSPGTTYSYTDTCASGTSVTEYGCSGTSPMSTNINCLTNVTNTCSGGICINNGSSIQPDSCIDTDGSNLFAVGTVTAYSGGSSSTYTDTCASATSVTEYTCSGTSPRQTITGCTNGYCQNGMCVTNANVATCTDTDFTNDGLNTRITGTAYGVYQDGTSYTISDRCVDNNNLIEMYCVNNVATAHNMECKNSWAPEKTFCEDGRCIVNITALICGDNICDIGYGENTTICPQDCGCTDSDNGQDINIKGVVRGPGGYSIDGDGTLSSFYNGISDACISTGPYVLNTLTEGYCAPNGIISIVNINCTMGCYNGTCINDQTIIPPPSNKCIDSDGTNRNTVGNLTINVSGQIIKITDSCINNQTVKEGFCTGEIGDTMPLTCLTDTTTKCLNGKCI